MHGQIYFSDLIPECKYKVSLNLLLFLSCLKSRWLADEWVGPQWTDHWSNGPLRPSDGSGCSKIQRKKIVISGSTCTDYFEFLVSTIQTRISGGTLEKLNSFPRCCHSKD